MRLPQGERRLFVGTASLLQSWHVWDGALKAPLEPLLYGSGDEAHLQFRYAGGRLRFAQETYVPPALAAAAAPGRGPRARVRGAPPAHCPRPGHSGAEGTVGPHPDLGGGGGQTSREGEKDIWWTAGTASGGTGHLGLTHTETRRGRAMDGLWTEVCGQQKQSNDPCNNQHNPQYANYWAPWHANGTARHIQHSPRHTNDWDPRTRKRQQQEHRPLRPTERSDPTQHAKGRTGDCPGPRKDTTTRRNVTHGGGGGMHWKGGGRHRPPPLASHGGYGDGDGWSPCTAYPASTTACLTVLRSPLGTREASGDHHCRSRRTGETVVWCSALPQQLLPGGEAPLVTAGVDAPPPGGGGGGRLSRRNEEGRGRGVGKGAQTSEASPLT